MKAIEEYQVSGTIDNEEINLKATAYRDNLKKASSLGLTTAVFQKMENIKIKGKDVTSNFVSYLKKHPELSKKIAVASLALVMSTTFVGCSIKPESTLAVNQRIEQAAELEEQRGEIIYIIKEGDNLENIVRKYLNYNITEEIDRVCLLNGIEDKNKIYHGQKLKIKVPISKLEQFGYTYVLGETTEWEAMDHFIYSSFRGVESDVHPQNIVFWRDRSYVLGGDSPHDIDIEGTPLLIKAASAIYDLEIMTGDQFGFYKDEDIKRKETEILGYYQEAIEITERTTGKKYGVDYILTPPIITVPLDKKLNM
ncbi:MAG: LysM domain-containing protein [Bacilli bacterium]|nr:LysM domain-containing protein [Bacilli bacterium]